MRLSVDEWSARVGRTLPRPVLRRVLSSALGDLQVALCLHRVGAPRPSDPQPYLTIPEHALNDLLELLLASRPRTSTPWLTATFDDGYADAVDYVERHAARYPEVEFLVFVCPEKVEQRAGFRWDLTELAVLEGRSLPLAEVMQLPVDLRTENGREDLRALVKRPEFELATAVALRALRRFPNVRLGNHTNTHQKATSLTPEQAREEYARSFEDFERLFGRQEHFAFPFGTPRHEFDDSHVALLRAQGTFPIWTTERRPYWPSERTAQAVLPRFPVNGGWGASGLAAWIAARALKFRAASV